jgi:cation-transporting P-type ATPase C
MLLGGLPFTAGVMAALMQLFPHLAYRKIVASERRLFARHRRRPTWARVVRSDGVDTEVSLDDLVRGDVVVVSSGELIPVDGVVESGAAWVVDSPAFRGSQPEDRSPGDAVVAGAWLREGALTIRVERAGEGTYASYIDSLLPRGAIPGLPSSLQAERAAGRNARRALAASGITLALMRTLRPAQAVLRPDYATAPRLSAQLSALEGIARGLQHGALFQRPSAIDLLANADLYVIDATAGLDRRRAQVARVEAVRGVTPDQIVAYTRVAQNVRRSERRAALAAYAAKRGLEVHVSEAGSLHASGGVTRYRDGDGRAIAVATHGYLRAANISVPDRFDTAVVRRPATPTEAASARAEVDNDLGPLWVVRDEQVIGVVSFARTGPLVGRDVVALLKAQNPAAHIVHVTRGDEAKGRALARALDIDFVADARTAPDVRDLGHVRREILWIGDGRDPGARPAIAASSVSVSVAPLSRASEDAAHVLLPYRGLSGLTDLLAISRAHVRRLARDQRTVRRVNLGAVGGAFVAGFSSLHAGLLSNLGTAIVYARRARSLDRLLRRPVRTAAG